MNSTYPSILDDLDHGVPIGIQSIAGGCIADAGVASFANGSKVFFKRAPGGREKFANDMFEKEAAGLRALAAAEAIRVPGVLAVNAKALVLELIRQAPKKQGFAEDFGRKFAALHGHHGKACGFLHDNYIGASPQINTPVDGPWGEVADEDGSSWPRFFLQRRLRFQVRLATSNGYGDELEHLLGRAEALLIDLLNASTEAPDLLHGDLWSGNVIVDDRGEACLIDPAVYYGHREADLAMTRLFGGFSPYFYAAYAEVSPLAPGHEDRLAIYQLYHILNHLNLFGGGYFEQSKRILQRYVR